MLYNVLWLNAIPGNRDKALTNLQKLAQMSHDNYGCLSRVFVGVTTGPIYQTGLVTAYDSMASMVNNIEALAQSESFQAWFGESTDLFAWAGAEWQTFRALRAPEEPFSNFINVVSIHITPGKLVGAREHMGKLAEHYESEYGRPVHILHPEGGLHYRHHWVVGYDSMEQYDEVQAALESDTAYGQWAVDMMGMFDNSERV